MSKLALPALVFSLLFLSHFALVSEAVADMYKYTDGKGVVNITNNLESVPAKYRSNMKVIREAPKPAPGAGSQAQQPQPEPAQAAAPQESVQPAAEAPTGKFAELSQRFPWFRPLVYLAVIVVLTMIVFKATSLLPSPLLSRAICIAFFLGVFVFLYKSYVTHVVESTAKIKENATNMMKKSMVREQPQSDAGAGVPVK